MKPETFLLMMQWKEVQHYLFTIVYIHWHHLII